MPIHAVITLSILCPILLVGLVIFLVIWYSNKRYEHQFCINRNGLIVKAKSPKKIETSQFINFMNEIISYVEESKERYVDDIIAIKQRFFKQSKEFAKSRIEAVKNTIIEEYKNAYSEEYSGITECGECACRKINNPPPSSIQRKEKDTKDRKASNPCEDFCSVGCNSGLAFFESRIQKDFKPILEEVYKIVEENHLINRTDREYEEEIMCKAEQLSSFLKNTVTSYPLPIDNNIAKQIIDKRSSDVKEAIADSLRRSRTLSITKREYIEKEKEKYITKRDRQISQIINVLNDEDITAILNSNGRIIE